MQSIVEKQNRVMSATKRHITPASKAKIDEDTALKYKIKKIVLKK
jgi:hypothetical protein